MLSLSVDTVRTWRHRFIDGGIVGLVDWRGQAPGPVRPEVHCVCRHRHRREGRAGPVWTHALIAEQSRRCRDLRLQIGRILADLDLKPRPGARRRDPTMLAFSAKATPQCATLTCIDAALIADCVDDKDRDRRRADTGNTAPRPARWPAASPAIRHMALRPSSPRWMCTGKSSPRPSATTTQPRHQLRLTMSTRILIEVIIDLCPGQCRRPPGHEATVGCCAVFRTATGETRVLGRPGRTVLGSDLRPLAPRLFTSC